MKKEGKCRNGKWHIWVERSHIPQSQEEMEKSVIPWQNPGVAQGLVEIVREVQAGVGGAFVSRHKEHWDMSMETPAGHQIALKWSQPTCVSNQCFSTLFFLSFF